MPLTDKIAEIEAKKQNLCPACLEKVKSGQK